MPRRDGRGEVPRAGRGHRSSGSGRGAVADLNPEFVSVVLPFRDAADTLPAQLEALARQKYDGEWEVVAVDHGSCDASVEAARDFAGRFPTLSLVPAPPVGGITRARNLGVAAARGDYLAFCDADDEVAAGWLAAIARAGVEWDMVGGRVDEESLNAGLPRVWRRPFFPLDRLPVLFDFLPFAYSSNCGIWKRVLTAVGGWNESFRRGCTDVELSWRVQVRGYRLGFAPDAVVRYRYRRTIGAVARQLHAYGRSEPRVYRCFREAGMRRPSLLGGALAWGRLAAGRGPRGAWISRAAYLSGRLRGSLEQRVLFA